MRRPAGNRVAAIACAGAILALGLYVALNWFRIEEEPTWVEAGKQARRDPFLAFSRFLERMGARPRALESPLALASLPAGSTLLFSAHRLGYMSPRNVRAVHDWVDQGGHLVVQAEMAGTRDPLLDAFHIRRAAPPAGTGNPAKAPREDSVGPARKFDWPGAPHPLRVEMPSSMALFDLERREPLASVSVRARTVALSVASGRGDVTVLQSFGFATNERIGRPDHALFAWLLASRGAAPAGVLTLLRFERPRLGEWIWTEAWTVVVAALLATALWLARVIPRFGPLAPDPPEARRSLAEHIVASGRFLWSRGLGRHLLAAVHERAQRAARLRRLPESEVPAVGGALATPQEFIAAIARLRTFEARLARRAPRFGTHQDKKP